MTRTCITDVSKIQAIKDTHKGLRQFLITESSLKTIKNAFYITLKALFVLKILKFSHDFLFMQRKRVD